MRTLKILVVVMGVMIIAGLGVLIAAVAGRVSRNVGTVHPFAAAPIEIPRGARIEALAAGSDRLVLGLALPEGGRRLVIVDLATGTEIGAIELPAAR